MASDKQQTHNWDGTCIEDILTVCSWKKLHPARMSEVTAPFSKLFRVRRSITQSGTRVRVLYATVKSVHRLVMLGWGKARRSSSLHIQNCRLIETFNMCLTGQRQNSTVTLNKIRWSPFDNLGMEKQWSLLAKIIYIRVKCSNNKLPKNIFGDKAQVRRPVQNVF